MHLQNLTADLAAAIDDEIGRAKAKFPGNKHLTVALMEEVGEAAQAQLQGKSREEIRKELIQVCCVAVRIIQEGDADLTEVVQPASQNAPVGPGYIGDPLPPPMPFPTILNVQ